MSKSDKNEQKKQSDTDWGLNESGQRKGGESKIALLLIMTLVCALGYFVYRKYEERGASVAQAGDFGPPGGEETAPESGAEGDTEQETPLELFGEPESETSDSFDWGPDVESVATDSGFDRSGEQGLPQGQGEPAILNWSAVPLAETEQTAPTATAELASDFLANSSIPPRETPEQTYAPIEDEQPTDLFGGQSEPVTAETSDPFLFDDPGPSETAGPNPGDPFSGTTEGLTESTTPAGSNQGSSPFAELPPQPASEATSNPWDVAPASGPTLEPLPVAETESPAPWQDSPEVIRVNSDDQISGAPQQAAAVDNPFFIEGEADLATESPSSSDEPAAFDEPASFDQTTTFDEPGTTEEPAAFDFGTPSPQSPPVDFSSPPANSLPNGNPPNSSAPPAGFGTDFSTQSASGGDPFTAATPAPGATTGFNDPAQVHTVQSGDSYWSIARRHYGAGRYFSALAAYNQSRVPDPNDLQPGMKILVPEADVLRQRFPSLLGGTYAPGQRDEPLPSGFYVSRDGQPMYRVGKNDTLSSIAEAHLGRASRWRQIYGMNQHELQNADRLQLGLELQLPRDASQAQLVSQPRILR